MSKLSKAIELLSKHKVLPATVTSVINNLANVSIAGGSKLRDVRVVGNVAVGDSVKVEWNGYEPVIMAPAIASTTSSSVSVPVPTTEVPQTSPFTLAGWSISQSGTIYTSDTYIYATGKLVLGTGDNIIALDSNDATYRIWAGDAVAADAPFSVSKVGAIKATSGEVGGWNLTASEINSDSGSTAINSATPFIKMGATAYNSGTGVWMGKDTAYKMFIGSSTGNKLLWTGTALEITGTITATLGSIGGWTIGTDSLSSTNIALYSGAANTARLQVGSSTNIAGVNSPNASGDIAFWAGATHANRATAPFRVTAGGSIDATAGHIGNWHIISGAIQDTETSPSIVLTTTGPEIIVGDIHIHGTGYIKNTDYVSGFEGFYIDGDRAEFGDVRVRGTLTSTILEYNEVQATAGSLGVWHTAGVAHEEFTTPSTTTTIYIRHTAAGYPVAMANDDNIWIKTIDGTGAFQFWGTLTDRSVDPPGHAGSTGFTLTYQDGASGRTVIAGTAIACYDIAGGGIITLSADDSLGASANLTMASYGATPWSDQTVRLRIGNLNGILDFETNVYGWAVGDDSQHAYYTPSTGLVVKGTITSIGVSTLDVMADSFGTYSTVAEVEEYWLFEEATGDGEIALVTDTGDTERPCLQIGNYAGNDQRWIIGAHSLPYNTGTLYKITCRLKKMSGTGTVYVGIAGRNQANDKYVNTSNVESTSPSSSHYIAASGLSVTAGVWYELTGYFRDIGTSTGETGAHADPADPAYLANLVRWVRPLLIVNYNSVAGRVLIDMVSIEAIPDSSDSEWRSDSDVTKIDGGTIYTGTIVGDSISLATKISINNATFGADGIQLDYNSGNPRAYIGDGSTKYFKFDGSNISWSGVNTSLTAAGAFTASNATITGTVTATAGSIAGWSLTSSLISSTGVKLQSGTTAYISFGTTPPTSPTSGTGVYIDKTGFYGLDGGTQQVKLDASDGILKAGGGAVTLDADGIGIVESDGYYDLRAYKLTYGGSTRARFAGYVSASTVNYGEIVINPVVGMHSSGNFEAWSPANYAASVNLQATSNTLAATLSMYARDDDTNDYKYTKIGNGGFIVGNPTLGTNVWAKTTGYAAIQYDLNLGGGLSIGSLSYNPLEGQLFVNDYITVYGGLTTDANDPDGDLRWTTGDILTTGTVKSYYSYQKYFNSAYTTGYIYVPYASGNKYLYDSVGQQWPYSGNAAVGSYTFDLDDGYNGLPSGIRAAHIQLGGLWSTSNQGYYCHAMRYGGSEGIELMGIIRSHVAGQVHENTCIVPVDSSGRFEVYVGGAQMSTRCVLLLGYFI